MADTAFTGEAMASVASVTVSIAAESMGILRVMSFVSLERISTSRVRPVKMRVIIIRHRRKTFSEKFVGDFDLLPGVIILAMGKGRAAD